MCDSFKIIEMDNSLIQYVINCDRAINKPRLGHCSEGVNTSVSITIIRWTNSLKLVHDEPKG